MTAIVEAVLTGMAVLLAGTIPRNIVFAANLRYLTRVPWAALVAALYLWCFWQYLRGWRNHDANAVWRRDRLRAKPLSARVWRRALIAGFLGLAALVVALRVLVGVIGQQHPHVIGEPLYHGRRQRAQQVEFLGFLLSQARSKAWIETHRKARIHSSPIIATGSLSIP